MPTARPQGSAALLLSVSLHLALAAGASSAGVVGDGAAGAVAPPVVTGERLKSLEAELVTKHGEPSRARIARGLSQAAALWRAGDGDADAFAELARVHFMSEPGPLEEMFGRLQRVLEALDGHLLAIGREMRWHSDLDLGPIRPFDEILAGWEVGAHVTEDAFTNRLAFAVLLNFPQSALAERLQAGAGWSRRQWAEARLVDRFSRRIPASAQQAVAKAAAEAGRYIAEYNIHAGRLLDAKGRRLFPEGMRLLSHWNLRDQIKADYADPKDGLARQRTLQQVMERIVTQTIPGAVVDNAKLDWNPFTNEVRSAGDGKAAPDAEPDTRYRMLLACFQAVRQVDPFTPDAPTFLRRRFEWERQMPEERVRRILEEVVASPLAPEVGKLIAKRLGRPLEPFDLWYSGFRPRTAFSEAELDAMTKKRFPTAEAYAAEIPRILATLGFSPEKAAFLARHIGVDAARGSGHAMGAARRGDLARLRTRVEKDGMTYKGFNIAVHEMGHNVEQVFSLETIDHTLLAGVPNNAFTEALAMVLQARDLTVLGLARPDPLAEALETLDDFWATWEIAGVAIVDIEVWRWMYAHPQATPAELKAATLKIARDLWDRYYRPILGGKDVSLLAVYSHMVDTFLYLPDYPVGHMIAFQIRRHVEKASASLGAEFERMSRIGNVAPDLWMKQATGSPVGPEALLLATREALEELGRKRP